MSQHEAIISWERGNSSFVQHDYSRVQQWSFAGGAHIQASPSPAIVAPPHSDPALIDPEAAFVAALASCHMLFILDICSADSLLVDHYGDQASGRLGRNTEGSLAITQVTLHPKVTLGAGMIVDPERLRSLHAWALARCFIANSVHTEIHLKPQSG